MIDLKENLPVSVKKLAVSFEIYSIFNQTISHLNYTVGRLLKLGVADIFGGEDEISQKDPWFNALIILGGYYVSLRFLFGKRVEDVDLAYRWIRTSISTLLQSDIYKTVLDGKRKMLIDLGDFSLGHLILKSTRKTFKSDARRLDRLALMYHDLFALAYFNFLTEQGTIEGDPAFKALIRRCLIEDPYGLGAFTVDLAREPGKLQMPLTFAAFVGLFAAYLQGQTDSEILLDAFKRGSERKDRLIPFLAGVLAKHSDSLPKDWRAFLRSLPPSSDFLRVWGLTRRGKRAAVMRLFERNYRDKEPSGSPLESPAEDALKNATENMKKRLSDFALTLLENTSDIEPEIKAFLAFAERKEAKTPLDFATMILFNLDEFARLAVSTNAIKPELWTLIAIWEGQESYLRYDSQKTLGKEYYIPILLDPGIGYVLVGEYDKRHHAQHCIPSYIMPNCGKTSNPAILFNWNYYEENPKKAISIGQGALRSFGSACSLLLARYRQISPVRDLYRLVEYHVIEPSRHYDRGAYPLSL